MSAALKERFAERRAAFARRLELGRLGVDPAAIRVPRADRVEYATATDEVLALARAAQAEDPALSSVEAMTIVFDERPDLLACYQRELAAGARPMALQLGIELTEDRACAFEAAVLAKCAAGVAAGDAYDEARRADPDGCEAYRVVSTYSRDGTLLLTNRDASPAAVSNAGARVPPTIERKKLVSTGGATVSSALAIIAARTREIMSATGVSESAAQQRALDENPSLYAEYVAAFRRRAAGPSIINSQDEG